jgi:hypothetical protein
VTPSDQGASKRFIDKGPYRHWRTNGAFSMPFVDRIGKGFDVTELIVKTGAQAPEPSVAGLARLLVEFERSLSGDPPDKIVLADASDDALAAALVATKLLIAVEATPDAIDPRTANGRLIAQLATYTSAA